MKYLKTLSIWFVRKMHPDCAVSLVPMDPKYNNSSITYCVPNNARSVEIISSGGGGGGKE